MTTMMTTTRPIAAIAAAVLAAGLAAGCVTARGGESGAADAARLTAPEPTWYESGIEAATTTPATFTVRLRADMPTPGYTFTVDAVEIDRDARRVVVRVTESAPGGVVSQVVTPATLAIEVGPLAPGRWVFELRTRRDASATHVPQWARVLLAV